MFGLFKKEPKTKGILPKYTDVYDVMRYQAPDESPKGVLPTIYSFRVKEEAMSPDPRPDFVLLEASNEIDEWHQVMAGVVSFNEDGHITDAPLLRWNDVPSLLMSDEEVIATYFPEQSNDDWPHLVVQVNPPHPHSGEKPARDRYYFQQNKIVAVM